MLDHNALVLRQCAAFQNHRSKVQNSLRCIPELFDLQHSELAEFNCIIVSCDHQTFLGVGSWRENLLWNLKGFHAIKKSKFSPERHGIANALNCFNFFPICAV